MFSGHNGIKLEIYDNKIKRKINIWKLKNIPLNNQWVKEEITTVIWKYFELKDKILQIKIWDAFKTLFTEKLIALNDCIRKKDTK